MIKKCKFCGKEFDAVPAQRRYCSVDCFKLAKNRRKAERYHKNKKKPEPKKCLICGKEFIPKKTNQKYCSKRCNGRAGYIKLKQRSVKEETDVINTVGFYQFAYEAEECCKSHGGIDNCPYDDCVLALKE